VESVGGDVRRLDIIVHLCWISDVELEILYDWVIDVLFFLKSSFIFWRRALSKEEVLYTPQGKTRASNHVAI
jgi:predicted nucleotidyltransferase